MTLKRLALLLPLVALGAAPRAEFRLEAILPETTLLFAETPSAPAFREAFKKTPLAKFFEDEEVRTFAAGAFDSALQTFGAFGAGLDKDFSVEKALEHLSGQVAFAMPSLVAGEKKEPDLVLAFDGAGHGDFHRRALAEIRKKYEEKSGKKAVAWKAGTDEVLGFELLPDVHLHLAILGETVVAA
ncbi:MAG: hypothetical protein HY293_15565, partial [Planctomycetes bacterium]|nr:hypothetical protein [Planctomycetota bacterium]